MLLVIGYWVSLTYSDILRFKDETELIRTLASALDGPELVINASDYFDNQRSDNTSSTNGTLAKRNPFNMTGTSWVESLPHDYQNRHPANHMAPAQLGPLRYHGHPSKYDPSAPLEDPYTPGGSLMSGTGAMRLDLPVDEDDYLMPSPQNNQNASAYLDLVADPNVSG